MARVVKKKRGGKRPPRGVDKEKGPRKPARADSIIDYPRAVKTGQVDGEGKDVLEWMPSLLDAVAELLPMTSRGHCVTVLSKRYGCDIKTVDRAIAKFKKNIQEELALDRPDLIASFMEKYGVIARKALRAGQFYAARGAVTDAAKLAGVMRPDTLLLGGGADQPADELAAQAKELEAIANARRNKKSA